MRLPRARQEQPHGRGHARETREDHLYLHQTMRATRAIPHLVERCPIDLGMRWYGPRNEPKTDNDRESHQYRGCVVPPRFGAVHLQGAGDKRRCNRRGQRYHHFRGANRLAKMLYLALARMRVILPPADPRSRRTSCIASREYPTQCDNVAMRSEGRGRPRLEQSRRPGKTAREEILDAAAELFTNLGYASTSTRRIADAVGVRQASLYHHFATKDDILDALLAGTVDEPLRLAAELLDENGPAAPRLHALVVGDVTQLCASRWNLGALYLLPELRLDRFEQFRLSRAELRGRYRSLAAEVIEECDGPGDADDLPFRLAESVINRRSDDTGCPDEQPWVIADGALRTLGFDGDFAKLHKLTAVRLGFADTVQV